MILAALGLDISNFSSKISEAGKKVSEFSSKGGSIGGGIAAGFAVAAAAVAGAAAVVGAAAAGMWAAMSEGGALVDLTGQTGIGIEKLMALKLAFQQAGLEAEQVGPVINKLQKQIGEAAQGNQQAAAMFQKLGLSIADIQAMSPEEQLKKVGDAIKKIEDPATKSAVAMEIFGKSGGKLLSLFTSGMDEAATSIGNQAQMMAANAGIFDKITDTLGTAILKLQGFFVGMASAIAPQLLEAVDAFNAIDLSEIGAQIGSWVAVVLEAFSQGTLGELIKVSFAYGIGQGINNLYTSVSAILAAVLEAFSTSFKQLFSLEYWGAFITQIVGLLQQGVGAVLQSIPGMGKTGGAMVARGEGNVAAGDKVKAGLNEQLWSNVADAMDTVMQAGGPIDVGVGSDVFGGLTDKLKAAAEARANAAREQYKVGTDGGDVGTVLTPMQKAGQTITTSLAAIGGAFGGAAATNDPLLAEARQQNTNLSLIVDNTARMIELFAPKQQSNQLVLA